MGGVEQLRAGRVGPRRLVLAVLLLAVSGCGGDLSERTDIGSAAATTTTPAPATTTPEPTAPPEPDLLITSAGDARRGVARIELSFPELDYEGDLHDQHAGSGFVIDSSGLLLTNQHVVGVGDEVTARIDDQTYTGSVVAASECSDVALVQVAAGDLPYFAVADSAPAVGTRITAVGYPSNEFTTSEGTIAAGTEALFTSEYDTLAVEHSATTLPGNSGGPLLTAEGIVVGMNSFALDTDADGRENFFAVSVDELSALVDLLRAGTSVGSIGVVPVAVPSYGTGLAAVDHDLVGGGVMIRAVDPDGPAAAAGIEMGDVISEIDDTVLYGAFALDVWCDIIRGADPSSPLPITVRRTGTGEVLTGELFGSPLAVESPLGVANLFVPDVELPSAPRYEGYVEAIDDQQRMLISVPEAWVDVQTMPRADEGGGQASSIRAAPDLAEADAGRAPSISMSERLGMADRSERDEILASLATDVAPVCAGPARLPYGDGAFPDGLFVGDMAVWFDCTAGPTMVVQLVAALRNGADVTIVVEGRLTTEADLAAMYEAFRTFDHVETG